MDRARWYEVARRGAIAMLLALIAGCAAEPPAPADQGEVPDAAAASPADANSADPEPAAGPLSLLRDRAWRGQDPGAPPGQLRIFLSDGTLLMDSCWEVYRLARWTAAGDSVIEWNEDGAPIRATIRQVDERSLTLALDLVSGTEEQRFERADEPYVCPEMAR